MNLLDRIEDRVSLPGDSERRRAQKKLVVVVSAIGAVATLINAVPMFTGGLDVIGVVYVASAFYIAAGALAVLIWPQNFHLIVFLLLLDVLIFPTATQILSGGFASGMLASPWLLFAPIGAALVLSVQDALVFVLMFVVSVLSIAVLEPYAAARAPEISDSVRISYNVGSLLSLGLLLSASSLYLVRQLEHYSDQADSLLLNVLPRSIADRLRAQPGTIADGYDNVTVLFADIIDFTQMSSDADPEAVVALLNEIFSEFDDLAARHGLEKIKTIGDAYMVAAGLPTPRPDHAEAILAFACDILKAMDAYTGFDGEPIRLRIGVNTGPVVAGVIGRQKFIYDLWGDAVNVASRMESNGLVNRIQVTQAVVDHLGDRYRFEARPPMPIKGKGMMVTYLVIDEETERTPVG